MSACLSRLYHPTWISVRFKTIIVKISDSKEREIKCDFSFNIFLYDLLSLYRTSTTSLRYILCILIIYTFERTLLFIIFWVLVSSISQYTAYTRAYPSLPNPLACYQRTYTHKLAFIVHCIKESHLRSFFFKKRKGITWTKQLWK
jgi:hypothetical protein